MLNGRSRRTLRTAVLYYDRYCKGGQYPNPPAGSTGNAWQDLNSSDPEVTRRAVNELARTHNGGHNGPNMSGTLGYLSAVENNLRTHFPGKVAGY